MIFKVPGTAEEGSPSAIPRPLCHLWTCYDSLATASSSAASSSFSRLSRGFELVEGSEGFTACPLGLKPGASASVHKGIWRAWWKPPCYLVRGQRGALHASLPTWKNKQNKSRTVRWSSVQLHSKSPFKECHLAPSPL